MATRIRWDEDGFARIQAATDGVVAERVIEPIAEDMRTLVPVLTAALQRTIRTQKVAVGHFQVWFGDVAQGVDYHLYVEYGTSKMDAQPYARPAAYRVRG